MSIELYKRRFLNLLDKYYCLIIIDLLLGALLTLAFSPFDLIIAVPISLLGFINLLRVVSNQSILKKFGVGFCFGFGHFTTSLYWLAYPLTVDSEQFAWLIPFSVTLIPALISTFTGLFAIVISSVSNQNRALVCFSFSSGWILTEYLRSYSILDFPWNLIGYTSNASIYFMQIISLVGIYGAGFLIVLAAVIFYTKKLKWIMAVYSIVALCFLYGYWRIPDNLEQQNAQTLKIRIIQPNLRTFDFKNNIEKFNALTKLIEMSNQKGYEDLDIIVWPESAFPFIMSSPDDLMTSPLNELYSSAKVALTDFDDIVHAIKFIVSKYNLVLLGDEVWATFLNKSIKSEASLFFGADRYSFSRSDNLPKLYNSMFAFSNQEFTFYDKKILVPFGEYIPWRNVLPFVNNIVGSAFEFSKGLSNKLTMNLEKQYSVIPLICFESIIDSNHINTFKKSYPLFHNSLEKKATFTLNITNDLWFGDSIGPYHHFTMSRMRSIEYGTSLVRVANSGISAIIDCYGRILSSCKLNTQEIQDFNLQLHSRVSIYFDYSLMPIILAIIALIFVTNTFLLYKLKIYKNI